MCGGGWGEGMIVPAVGIGQQHVVCEQAETRTNQLHPRWPFFLGSVAVWAHRGVAVRALLRSNNHPPKPIRTHTKANIHT